MKKSGFKKINYIHVDCNFPQPYYTKHIENYSKIRISIKLSNTNINYYFSIYTIFPLHYIPFPKQPPNIKFHLYIHCVNTTQ